MVIADEAEEAYGRELASIFRDVRALAVCNRAYFKGASGVANERFYSAFSKLLDHLDHGLVRGVNAIQKVAPLFDFDKAHPGNGYRSMITIVRKCCLRILTISRHVTVNRESYLFRANHYSRELEAYVTTLGQLRASLYYLQKLIQYSSKGDLFPNEDALSAEEYRTAEGLMQEVEYLSQESFYGRCLGFQFCESMVRPLTTINIAMACYSEGYVKSKSSLLRLANSVLSCRKYLINPERRAKQVVNMTRVSDIHFCKSFWSLPENSVMHNVPLYLCPTMAVCKVITIDPIPFELPLVNGSGSMAVLPPSAHTGVGPVITRLISSEYRSGQEVWFSHFGLRLPSLKTQVQKSPFLIIHCHGGGFVAQSSASHQMYLNFWANDLGIPILSVDYTLAPENYFPRQQEELFFAYCWALKNAHQLGSLAEKICIIGDSAGANIAVSVALRLASCGLRSPDAVISIYGSLLVKYSPSPSRILALMDPLLPLGILSLCLRAYTGDAKEDGLDRKLDWTSDDVRLKKNDDLQSCEQEGSPLYATSSQLGIISGLSESQNFQQTLVRGKSPRGHQRSDSGFFDVSEQSDSSSSASLQQSVERAAEMACTPGDVLLQERDSAVSFVSSSISFLQKDSSDEDSDSLLSNVGLSSSSDEQSGNTFLVGENETLGANASHSSCRNINGSWSNLQQTVCASSGHVNMPLFPLPDSSSPLMSNYAKLCHFNQSPMESSRDIKITKDPFVSPVVAPDDLLRKLCPVYLLGCHLDPLLDDSITFAQRLRQLGKDVHLELIPDMPHGFLNFVLVSPEAKAASGRCALAIRKMLGLEEWS